MKTYSDQAKAAAGTTSPYSLAAWRALPRLLLSRQWRWITLGVVVVALVLMRFGFWQLDRLAQRRAYNAVVAERLEAEPLTLTGQPLDVDANEFRRVRVRGVYDSKQEVVLRNQSLDGMPGMHVLTPLRIAGSDQSVLIDRGWIPLTEAERDARTTFAPTVGEVVVEGVLKKPQVRTSTITPVDALPEGGRLDAWFRADVGKIAEQVPYPLVPFYVEQLPTDGETSLPRPQPRLERGEGSHLSYALQWFSFAVIAVVGYATFVVSRGLAAPAHKRDRR